MLSEHSHGNGGENSPPAAEYELLESLNYPVCVLGSDGVLIYGNSSFQRIFKPEGDDVRLDWEHPFFPEYRKRIAKSYLSALKGQEKRCFAVLNSPDGKQMPVEIYLFPMSNGERITSILVLMNVVDDRILSFDRSTLSIVSEDNFQYESILYEHSPLPLLRFNRGYEIIKSSENTEAFLGFPIKEFTGSGDEFLKSVFIYDAERIKKAILDIIEGTLSSQRIGEVKVASKDGFQKLVNLVLFPIIQENEITAAEMIVEDLTRLKEMKNQISTMKRVNLINNITKGLLHSFNNTINVIMSKTQLLLQISEKDSVIDGIQLIEEAALEIIDQIRRFNNYISSENIEEEVTEPLISVIEDAIEFFRLQFKIEEKDAKRSVGIERKYFTNLFILTNTKLLREMIITAIQKVSDYITARGIIEITLKENSDLHLQIRVIKQESQEEPLHSEYTATGIDIRQTAEKLGIKVIEEESSEFYSIKMIIPAKLIRDKQEKETEEMEYKLRDLDIIIVEDETALQKILFELFDKMGNRVFICSDGNVGLEEFKRKHYDMVITDYGIEGITGLELAARIKELDEHAVTILLSGWLIDDIPSHKNIIDLFIPKPFKLDEMLKRISKVFVERKKRQEVHEQPLK